MSEGGTAQAPIRVLVIDDEAGVRRIFSRLLSRAEMDVTEACDGFEALAILEKQRFDVILSDITMPGVQKPHCEPCCSIIAHCTGCRLPSGCRNASTVITLLPSSIGNSRMQALTAL